MYRILTIFLLLSALTANAQVTDKLENVRNMLTNSFHNILGRMDNTIECDANCTHPEIKAIRTNRIHIITSVKSTEAKRFSTALNLRGKLYFPKLDKKFRLTFNKQSTDTFMNKLIDRENDTTVTDDKFRIGLQYLFIMSEQLELSTRLGVKIHNGLKLFQEFTIQRAIPLSYGFSLLNRARLYYYYTQLYLAKSIQINLVKPLSEHLLISQTNDWYANTENRHERHLVHHLKLHHHVDRTNHLVYWISYASLAQDDSTYRQDWQAISLSYIHYFSKWFYVQFVPRIIQKRENRFRNEFEGTVSFGMILGK